MDQLNSASQQLPQTSDSHRTLHRLALRLSLSFSSFVFLVLPSSPFCVRLRSSFFFFFFGTRILQRLCLHLLKRNFPESKLKSPSKFSPSPSPLPPALAPPPPPLLPCNASSETQKQQTNKSCSN